MGAGDRIVGVSAFSNYPPEAATKTVVGSFHAPDVEKIIALDPDIVFAGRSIHTAQLDMLRSAGIKIIEIEPQNLEDILNSIIVIGNFIGEEKHARILAHDLNTRLQNIERLSADLPRRKVFVEIWGAPLMTIGTKSYINDIVDRAGGINVIDRPRDYTTCDIEMLYAKNPDVYVVLSKHNDSNAALPIALRPGYRDLPAIKNGNIVFIVDDLINRSGPRCIEGTEEMFRLINKNRTLNNI